MFKCTGVTSRDLPKLAKKQRVTCADYRPEDELLLCCACIHLEPERIVRLNELLHLGLEWDYLLQAGERQGLIPLLYHHLGASCLEEAIPSTALQNLRDLASINARRNLSLTAELISILALFEREGLTAVPFKGPALAALVYGNISMRQFADLDVFIHQDDLPRLKEILIPLGYQPELSLFPAREAAYLKSQYHYVMINQTKEIALELHWEFTPKYLHFPLPSKDLWQRLEDQCLAGRVVPNFSSEDLLLILCVHGAEHSWERLAWICDVAALIEVHQEMRWGRVLDLARDLGCERMLYLGLYLAKDLSGAAIPDDLWQRLQAQKVVPEMARQVSQFRFEQGNQALAPIRRNLTFQVRVRERLRDQLMYLFFLPLTPTIDDWQFVSLPGRLAFLYYLIRPFRLIVRHGLRIEAVP